MKQDHLKNKYHRIGLILKISIEFISLFLVGLGLWISTTFDNPSFEQILFNLYFGLPDFVFSKVDPLLLRSFIRFTIIMPIIFLIICYNFVNMIKLAKRSIFLIAKAPYLFLVLSLLFLAYKIEMPHYLKKRLSTEDYFAEHYLDPGDIDLHKSSKTKNLILIYVESLENTFANESRFGENLLNALDVKEIGGQSFENYKQVERVNYTATGIVSTQCGLPLHSFTLEAVVDIDNRRFLPGAVCLGDVLKGYGYKNIFINGSMKDIAGISKFFSSHGYDQVYAKEEIIAKGYKFNDGSFYGGVHDDDILKVAKSIIDENEKNHSPYNLTILTLDTHGPEGTPSLACAFKDEARLNRAVKCTAHAVADLVRYVEAQGYLKNTNIIIVGDHLFIANNEQSVLRFYGERYIFNRFISEENFQLNRNELLHFDMLPTILYTLGIYALDGRMGLGFSGFGALPSSLPGNRFEELNQKSMNYSPRYLDLWKARK